MDKAALLTNRVTGTTATVEIDGLEGPITVRALSRHELLEASKHDGDNMKKERYILSCAMVDPVMGEHDVAEWQKISLPGEINRVADKINEISGLKQGADKSGVPAAGTES